MSRTKHRSVCYECKQYLHRLDIAVNGRPSAQLAAIIRVLNSQMALLEQAWSTMAGRNLINDILGTLGKMEAIVPASAKPDLIKLKAVVSKAVFSHQVTNSRYDSVVCLGFRIKVAGDAYTGHADDWQDMKARCDEMKVAVRAAYGLVDPVLQADKRVLKIFMAPEFYFRGRNGAYDFAEISGMAPVTGGNGVASAAAKPGLLDLMREELDKTIYSDWLFVLGSAIGASKVTKEVCGTCGADLKFVRDVAGKTKGVCVANAAHTGPIREKVLGAQVDNICFIYKEKELFTVSKELVSDVDFVADKSAGKTNVVNVGKDASSKEELAVMRTAVPSGYKAANARASKFTDERMGGSIFTIDGVKFGLEVCLDHAATTSSAASGRLSGAANIQVQLIPSAGMWIGSMSTRSNGIVFNVDGSVPHVQAVGMNANTSKLEMHSAVGPTEDNRKYNKDVAWNPANMSAKLDLESNSHWSPKWQSFNVPKAAAGSGNVLMYGPYELP